MTSKRPAKHPQYAKLNFNGGLSLGIFRLDVILTMKNETEKNWVRYVVNLCSKPTFALGGGLILSD